MKKNPPKKDAAAAGSAAAETAPKGTAELRGTTEIELQDGVQFASEFVKKITLQPIDGGLYRSVPLPKQDEDGATTPHYFLELASRASGYPPVVFDRMTVRDAARVVRVVAGLVDPS